MTGPACCQKVKFKAFLLTTIAVFVTMFITDYLIHEIFMGSQYAATAHLWRPKAQMGNYFPWMLIGQFLISVFFTRLFAHGYQGKGLCEGVCFGIMFAGVFAGVNFIYYAVVPYPLTLILTWTGFGFVQCALLGAVAAKVYKLN